jgi:sugar-specific transcriptional regulator TrmB/DNA-binding CsgD family transcriptional regulator
MTLTASGVDTVVVSGARPAAGRIAQLTHLGLDPAQEAAYRATLERPEWTVEGLARRLAAPAPRVAEVAAGLVELDLVRTSTDGSRLRAVDPQLALTALIARREAEMVSAWHELERARQVAADLAVDFDSAHRGHLDATLDMAQGLDAVRARVTTLVSQARTEVVSLMLSGWGFVDPLALPRRADLADAEARVRHRVIAVGRACHDPLSLRHLRGVATDGSWVRTAGEVPMSALVVDRVAAVFPLSPMFSRRHVGAVVLRLPSVVATTVELFERVWGEATPLDEAVTGEREELAEKHRDVLRFMLAGCTHEVAARKLDISVRTVRRRMAELNDRLGARGPFQAGALAAERGWITPQMLRDVLPDRG